MIRMKKSRFIMAIVATIIATALVVGQAFPVDEVLGACDGCRGSSG